MCADSLAAALLGKLGVHERVYVYGLGTHDDPVEAQRQLRVRSQTIWVITWLAALACGITKVSVLLFYKRIFLGKVFSIANWVLMTLSVMWTIAFFFANFLDCKLLKENWTRSAGDESGCIDKNDILWVMVISDVILDAMILSLPWYPLSKLQMPLLRKVWVCGVLLLGGLVVAAGIVRLTAVDETLNSKSEDASYVQSSAFYWVIIEAGIGVVSACLPTFGPLFQGREHRSTLTSLKRVFQMPFYPVRRSISHGYLRLKRSVDGKKIGSMDSLKVPNERSLEASFRTSAAFSHQLHVSESRDEEDGERISSRGEYLS